MELERLRIKILVRDCTHSVYVTDVARCMELISQLEPKEQIVKMAEFAELNERQMKLEKELDEHYEKYHSEKTARKMLEYLFASDSDSLNDVLFSIIESGISLEKYLEQRPDVKLYKNKYYFISNMEEK